VIRSDGKFVRDYFYVEDGAAAYMLLAERLLQGDAQVRGQGYNFSNEIQVTVTELVTMILQKMNSALVPDIRNEASNEIVHQYLSAERARTQLDWHPLFTLDEGLTKTVQWYRNFIEG
jgi:CDP-glucose 4,6-dehydratase